MAFQLPGVTSTAYRAGFWISLFIENLLMRPATDDGDRAADACLRFDKQSECIAAGDLLDQLGAFELGQRPPNGRLGEAKGFGRDAR